MKLVVPVEPNDPIFRSGQDLVALQGRGCFSAMWANDKDLRKLEDLPLILLFLNMSSISAVFNFWRKCVMMTSWTLVLPTVLLCP